MDVAKINKKAINCGVAETEKPAAMQPEKEETVNPAAEALAPAEEEEPAAKAEISRSTIDMMKKELERIESSKEGFINLGKIMEIARRIARGDKVPACDEKMLLEFDHNLYQSVKMQAMMAKNRNRKKHESLFEDEKEKEMQDKLNALETESVSADALSDMGAPAADIAADAGAAAESASTGASGSGGGEASAE